jgi:hypothetical protein
VRCEATPEGIGTAPTSGPGRARGPGTGPSLSRTGYRMCSGCSSRSAHADGPARMRPARASRASHRPAPDHRRTFEHVGCRSGAAPRLPVSRQRLSFLSACLSSGSAHRPPSRPRRFREEVRTPASRQRLSLRSSRLSRKKKRIPASRQRVFPVAIPLPVRRRLDSRNHPPLPFGRPPLSPRKAGTPV